MTDKLKPEELAEQLGVDNMQESEEEEEELDAVDFIASAMAEIVENGLPVKAIKESHRVLDPLVKQVSRQNEILEEISRQLIKIASRP